MATTVSCFLTTAGWWDTVDRPGMPGPTPGLPGANGSFGPVRATGDAA